jgi:hypothetical protein
MANFLLDAIAQGASDGKPLIWLDAEDYGSVVLRNGKPFPWTNPTEFISSYSQLQSLLRPDVIPVNLGSFLSAWLDANPAALNEMSGKQRTRFALRKLLAMEAPRIVIREIVSALCESVPQPVVLVLPENSALIKWANRAANNAPEAKITDIDIDTVSVYLADFLRTFSGLNVAGVLVQFREGAAVNDELLDLYSPIINVAKHYHWALAVQVEAPALLSDTHEQIDLVISDHCDSHATVLGDDFWQQETISGSVTRGTTGLYFSHVPPYMQPEAVLEQIALLGAQCRL